MTECSSCGTEMATHETHCPVCGKPTAYYHRQRRCLHCGTPAAEKVQICMMCHKPIDSLPLSTSIFSGSWLGISLGVLIIVGLVIGANYYQKDFDETSKAAAQISPSTPTLTPTFTPTPGPTNTPTLTPTPTPSATPTPRIHIIQSGENLSSISILYGVTIDELIDINDIANVRGLQPGQELVIPKSVRVGDENENDKLPSQIVYVIEVDDTLLDIALRYGITIEAIMALNPSLNPDLIYPGQEIVVPLATPTPTPTPTATSTYTPTPGPPHDPPKLLSPADGQIVVEPILFFHWTATGLLADDEFYVLQLTWPDYSHTEYWTKSNSWRLDQKQPLIPGPLTWKVTIMRQTGTNPDNMPIGIRRTDPGEQRTVEWR